jgi:hypothetical protein
MAFQPPLFGDFGKKAKDLFKKKYEFDNQLVVINKTADGHSVESKIIAANDAPLRGHFKSTCNVKTWGQMNGVCESEFHTVADKESKVSYKFTEFMKNLSVKLSLVGVRPEVKGETPDFPEGWGAAEATWSQDYFSGSAGVRSNGQKTLLDFVGAIGYENFSVGGKAVADLASKAAPNDVNFGVEYLSRNNDYVVSAYTEKKRSTLVVSYLQNITKKHSIGASLSYGLTKPGRTLTVGTDYPVDIDTTLRAFAKIDSNKDNATVSVAAEHRLSNALVGVAAEFNVAPSATTAGKLGVSVTLGDF